MTVIIDLPTPFAPDAEWLAIREELKSYDPTIREVADALKEVAEELDVRGLE